MQQGELQMAQKIFTEQGKRDFEWLVAHAQELVKMYPDQWVAVYQGEVVGIGKSGEDALQQARDRIEPGGRPVVNFVEGGAYVY
jgi:ubiquinone/menaquinone biosynthesis C-methylase UbiE